MSEEDRKAFEEWAKNQVVGGLFYSTQKTDDGYYINSQMQEAWEAWQAALAHARLPPKPRPLAEYHEYEGAVLWWTFPIHEGPWCGTPTCSDWPGYHTHWTPLVLPADPLPSTDGLE